MSHIIGKKTRSHSTLSISTRLRKVVSRTKHSTLLLLALVSVKVCLCAMSHLPHSWEEKRTIHYNGDGEEKIAERIDANLLNVPIQEITDLPKVMFENKVTSLAQKTQGTLIIKEYPTVSLHMLDISKHFSMNLPSKSHLDLISFSLTT